MKRNAIVHGVISVCLFALAIWAVYSGRDASAYIAALLVVTYIGASK